jgi:multidrug efflux pump subunit AcrA (membrane-fusion protein)
MTLRPPSSDLANQRTPSRGTWKYATAVLLCCLALAGCKQAEAPPEVLVTVQAAKPEVAPISEHVEGDAILSPLAEAALSPKISAPVKKFYVQRGSHVHAGQLLVTLEDRDLQGTALDNQGSYTAARATYQQATSVQLPEATQTAQLDLAQAKANLSLNESIVRGRTQLFQEGAIPGRDLDTAKAALVQAQAAYDTAAKHLQALESVGRAASGQLAQGELTSAKGKYLNAEALASYASLRSPIDGVVTDRPLFAGEMAPAGTPLITVMDTSSLIAKLHLSQAMVQRMKVGDKAQVVVRGVDAPIDGTVSLISPALDPGSTTVEVWVKLTNPDGKLKAGTPVHVAIVGRTVPDALQVPTSALLTADDGSLGVMVVDSDSTAHLKPVTIGIRLPDTVQILSGIGPGDLVIDTGGYGLQDGTKVKLAAPGDDKSTTGSTAGSTTGGQG